jgi:hypothetical protein
MRKGMAAIVLGGLASAAVVSAPRAAEAQAMTGPTRVNALPQGLIGGAFLGAEAVILIEGAAGVRNRWVLLGTGAAGLVAGGVGGFFVDQALDSAPPGGTADQTPTLISTAMLVVGLGLVIPTAIVYAGATMYRPEDGTTQVDDNAPANVPLEENTSEGVGAESTGGATSDGAAPAGGAPAGGGGGGRSTRRRLGPEALLNYTPGQLRLGLPAVAMVRSYSLEEQRQYGQSAMSEWRVPLLSASF